MTAIGVYCVGHNSSGNHRCFGKGGSHPSGWKQRDREGRRGGYWGGGPDTEKKEEEKTACLSRLLQSNAPPTAERPQSQSRAESRKTAGAAD